MIKEGVSPERSVEKAVKEKFHLPFAGGKVRKRMQEKAVKTLKKFVRKHKDVLNELYHKMIRLGGEVE
mgnify:CR=1 FL=1